MTASDPLELARIWADATPLHDFIANRAAAVVNYADLPEIDRDEDNVTVKSFQSLNRTFAVADADT